MTDADTLDRVASLVDAAPDLVMACHIGPDGDALGSAFALATAARGAGRSANVVLQEPVPDRLAFLGTEMKTMEMKTMAMKTMAMTMRS